MPISFWVFGDFKKTSFKEESSKEIAKNLLICGPV